MNTSLLRSGAAILSANAFNNAVAFVVTVAAAAFLGAKDFGPLGLGLAIVAIVALVEDFGLGVAVVRAHATSSSPTDRARLAPTVLTLKVLLATGATGAATLLPASFVSEVFPPLADNPMLLVYAVLGGSLQSVWLSVRTFDQAAERFAKVRTAVALYGALRIFAFAVLVLVDAISAVSVLVCLYPVPLTGLLLAQVVSALWRTRGLAARPSVAVLRRVMAYGIWTGISAICFTLLGRIPMFALSGNGRPEDLSVFAAALTFLTAFSLLNDAARMVLLPSIVKVGDFAGRVAFRAAVRRRAVPYFAVMLAGIAVMAGLYGPILGAGYEGGALVFVILAVATIVTIYLGIQNSLLHSFGLPRPSAVVDVARALVLSAVVYVLPPDPVVLAIAFAIALLAGELSLYWYVRHLDKPADRHLIPLEPPP